MKYIIKYLTILLFLSACTIGPEYIPSIHSSSTVTPTEKAPEPDSQYWLLIKYVSQDYGFGGLLANKNSVHFGEEMIYGGLVAGTICNNGDNVTINPFANNDPSATERCLFLSLDGADWGVYNSIVTGAGVPLDELTDGLEYFTIVAPESFDLILFYDSSNKLVPRPESIETWEDVLTALDYTVVIPVSLDLDP